MKTFHDQVEILLTAKSKSDLKAFILRISETVPEDGHYDFLELLENKRVIISDIGRDSVDVEKILARIQQLLENIEGYEIEAYYNDDWSGESYYIESDDGFCEDLTRCYEGAVQLLNHGLYRDAADAFRLLSESIVCFDQFNECNDNGAIYVHTFIDENLLHIDLNKITTMGLYSALLSGEAGHDWVFDEAYQEIAGSNGKLTFSDIINAGNKPVPNMESLLEEWISYLYDKTVKATSTMLKEAAVLAGLNEIDVMEKYIDAAGASMPIAYINLCELYLMSSSKGTEPAIRKAVEGLKNSNLTAYHRGDLARLLSRLAKETEDDEVYKFAISECFYSTKQLIDFLPIVVCNDTELMTSAISFLDQAHSKPGYYRSSDEYYAIHFINQEYDFVYSVIEKDSKALGWTGNSKSMIIPLFIGLLAGFSKKAVTIERNIGTALGIADTELLLRCLRDNIGAITEEQESLWYERCLLEVEARTDAIVSGGFRGSYIKAAKLLVAIAEMEDQRKENDPMEIIRKYVAKYPRHSAFRGELRTVLAGTHLPKIKV